MIIVKRKYTDAIYTEPIHTFNVKVDNETDEILHRIYGRLTPVKFDLGINSHGN